MESWTASEGKN